MLTSLYTGVSGLDAHQQMLDTASNNIANVNTVGYKASNTMFEDTLAQTVGRNAAGTDQVGLGVRVAGTQTNFTQGVDQFTGKPSDMLINGDGFFVVNRDGQQLYTRAGSFTLDTNGHLVSPDGGILQSANGGDLDLSAIKSQGMVSWSLGANGVITGVKADGTSQALGTIALATFANPQGLLKVGGSAFEASPTSGPPSIGAPGSAGLGSVTSGYLEGSNVDLATELTGLIVAERGFQANSRVISTSDEVLQTLVNLKN